MAYVAVEADERLEEGPDGLEFKSFLGTSAGGARAPSASQNLDRGSGCQRTSAGYMMDGSGGKGSAGFWSIDFYQPYFHVDTITVLQRCYHTLLPFSPSYLSTFSGGLDLYGTFWVPTTLILALFMSSSLAASIASYLSAPGAEYDYDFALLGLATTIVYAYAFGLPLGLWLSLRYLGVGEWSIVDALGIWGYGLFVWIPVSILCVIPNWIVRWTLVGVAFGLSGYFLIANVYPILASADAKATRLLIIVIGALHAALALTFKIMFFSYYVVADTAPGTDPTPR
ncbi:hypothetical protein J3A83DRAFT_4514544 [Scleroderma citrinum]